VLVLVVVAHLLVVLRRQVVSLEKHQVRATMA
jgi:hypothetical protein